MRYLLVVLACALAFSAGAQSVYPSAEVVPVNLLRLSIVFDRAQQTQSSIAVHLTRPDGKEIDGAFFPQRLWSPDRRTLTLYLDPGRVKSGLELREDRGPILRQGDRAQLRLGDAVLKSWSVGPAVELPIRPDFREMSSPKAGTRDPVVLTFPTPIDWQGRNLVAVASPDGRRLQGRVTLIAGESVWQFVPDQPWSVGRYAVRLNADLEDPAGNRLFTTFELPTGRANEIHEDVSHAFTVSP